MSLCNTYLRQIMLVLLTYSVLIMYVFVSSQSVFAAALHLDIKPATTIQPIDKAVPALCVQVNLAPCTAYNPLQLQEPELFKSISGSTIQIHGLDWAMATISNMYLAYANMISASYSCASVSELAASAVLTVSVQMEGGTGFSATMQLPVKLETGKTYNVCASGIGSDQRTVNNKKTVLLFQIKTLNSTVVSQVHRNAAQSDTTPLSLLSTIALFMAIIAIMLYISVSRHLNMNAQDIFYTIKTPKNVDIGSKAEKEIEGCPEDR